MGMNQKFYTTTGEEYIDESLSYQFPASAELSRSFSRRRRDYKGSHLRKSLKPKRGHSQIEISRELSYNKNKRNHSIRDFSYRSNANTKHGNYKGIKVTQTSKFARKGMNNRKRVIRSRQRQ